METVCKKRDRKEFESSIPSEVFAKTAESFRGCSKKRKNWLGKKRPIEIVDEVNNITAEDEELSREMRRFSKQRNIEFDCPYCQQKYVGSWERDHIKDCKPPPQKLKSCYKCNKNAKVPFDHICGSIDTYYTVDDKGFIDEVSTY